MVSLSAFITSLITSGLIFALLVLVFTFLSRRPANRFIYYPALIIDGRETPESSKFRGPWTWMWEAFISEEEDVIAVAGLDAAIYMQLYSTALKIIFYSAAFLLPVLIPLAGTDKQIKILNSDPATATNSTKLDEIAMGNIQPRSGRLWAFFLGVYWLSFVTYWVLRDSYKHVIKLRRASQGHIKARPEQFACLVRDIPPLTKHEARSEQVDNFFRHVHPETYEKSLVVTKLDKASKVWTELEKAKAKLAHAEAVYELSKTKENPDGVRPQHKTGTLGLYGAKVDSIDYWSEKIKDLPAVLRDVQDRTKTDKEEGAAVIFFNSRRAAAEAAQETHSSYADRWQVLPAPEPRAVIWDNMNVGFYSRLVREPIVYVCVFFTVVFYMIPIVLIASFTTLDNLTKYLPFIKPIVKIKPLKTIIEAYLPQLALTLFLALLPKLLLAFSRAEGIVSKAHLVRAASGKMFYFVVFNVFIGFTIFGTLFDSSDSISKLKDAGSISFGKIINLFGSSLPGNATYFITFVALKFFVGYGLELSRLVPLAIYHLKMKYLCKTETERKAAWAPGSFDYLSNIPNDLLVVTITMSYAVIAPLILVFSGVYFGLGYLVQRNQALKVYVPDYESGGRFWPHIHSRFLVGLMVSQITAIGYFGIKKFPYAVFLLPLPFVTLFFANIMNKVYYPSFKYLSIETASEEVKEVPTLSAVVDAFTPTCLLAAAEASENDKFEDTKFEDAESRLPSRTSSGIASPTDQPRRTEVVSADLVP